jgi:hypothetical protein
LNSIEYLRCVARGFLLESPVQIVRFSDPHLSTRRGALQEGRHQLTINHQNAWAGSILLMNALGTTSWNFLEGLLKQLIPLCHYGEEISETALNSMLAAIKGIAPRDETEAMLAAQMVAIHSATMTAAGQLMYARGPEQDLVCTRLNKFARTYAAQVEAFKKYRSGGEQTSRSSTSP